MAWNNTTIHVKLPNGEHVGLSVHAISLGMNHERARKRWWTLGKPTELTAEQYAYIFAPNRNVGSKALYTITVEIEGGETVGLTLAEMPKYFRENCDVDRRPWFYRQRWEKAGRPMYAKAEVFICEANRNPHEVDSGNDEWRSLGCKITAQKIARLAAIPLPTNYEARL